MKFFSELGRDIQRRWRAADCDERAFSTIAAEALAARPPSACVDPLDVVRWVQETDGLVPQIDIRAKFGEPPVSVFDCEGFVIQVLFWVDGTTTVHQHGFSGAFHVMAGSSIHSVYDFAPKRRYCAQLATGTLNATAVELLGKGDVRTIVCGSEFIHALFHCDRPTVSVVVRTRSEPGAGPQYQYFRAGLAYDPFHWSEALARKVQTLELLLTLGHPEFEATARESVRRADAFQAFQILQHLDKPLGSRFVHFLEGVRSSHRELVDVLLRHAEGRRREDKIISFRALVSDPELRFLLALLLNVPDRVRMMDLVERAYPDRKPGPAIAGWLSALSRPNAILDWADSVRGAPRQVTPALVDGALDTLTLRIVALLLEGSTVRQVAATLKKAHPGTAAPSMAAVAKRCAELRRSELLRPLFE